MKKAIVFAGGGSKGAYQIGVWKALNELGEHFDIATGTSIGAINAGFYVQHDFDAAYEMWTTLTPDEVMANGLNLEKSFGAMFAQRGNIRSFFKEYVNNKGADVSPLHDCIKKYYDPAAVAASDIDFAIMTAELTSVTPPAVTPVTVTKEEILGCGEDGWKWIAASAAAWPVFPVMQINGKNYVDGGYYDNIPVAAALRLGAERVLTVCLKPDAVNCAYEGHPWIDCIRPSKDLGTFLNFERSVLDRSIDLGYCDTMKHFGRYYGKNFTLIPGSGADLDALAKKFINVLTADEAAFLSREKYHFQMGSRDPGCVPLLAGASFEGRTDEKSLFAAALEKLLSMLGFDENTAISVPAVLTALTRSLCAGNVPQDFSGENALENMRAYIISEYDERRADIRAAENDYCVLAACALAKTLM